MFRPFIRLALYGRKTRIFPTGYDSMARTLENVGDLITNTAYQGVKLNERDVFSRSQEIPKILDLIGIGNESAMIKRSKAISILVLLFILTGVIVGCLPSTQSGGSRTLTIAVVEDDPGEADSPNPQSTYAGVKFAADQFAAHSGINEVGS